MQMGSLIGDWHQPEVCKLVKSVTWEVRYVLITQKLDCIRTEKRKLLVYNAHELGNRQMHRLSRVFKMCSAMIKSPVHMDCACPDHPMHIHSPNWSPYFVNILWGHSPFTMLKGDGSNVTWPMELMYFQSCITDFDKHNAMLHVAWGLFILIWPGMGLMTLV